MHATCVEDLQLFQRARRLMVDVFALTRGLRTDFWLRDQLNESAESIVSNISEGFSQGTDRAFARYLTIAAGSAEELRVHIAAALAKHVVAETRATDLVGEARETANMTKALIRYLHRCNRTDRLARR